MITQEEIVKLLNKKTLKRNLTWEDVKYEADNAIVRINDFLGTKYPTMSSIMTYDKSTYSINQEGVMVPIFPDEHIHNVVIPFIAMEVLANDEEFTTIYNKYAADYDNGLFSMFKKEFNRVPLVFRQDPDAGVFFASDSREALLQRNKQDQLPVFKFHVTYDVNEPAINQEVEFVRDTRAYLYGDVATIKGWNTVYLSTDGVWAYTFRGWTRNQNEYTDATLQPGAEVDVMSDIKLYAMWDKECTLDINALGAVSIKNTYRTSIKNLTIPSIVKGVVVRSIPINFILHPTDPTKHANNIEVITLPPTLTLIDQSAFNGFKGHTINIDENPISPTYQGITIANSAFQSTPNLTSIIIPSNVIVMSGTPFPVAANKIMNIYVRHLQAPGSWNGGWAAGNDTVSQYTVNIYWGFNF